MVNYFERNISLNYIITGLIWGRFFIPVLALFYIASQVSLAQFTIIMSVFALSTLVLEIPSGAIADLLGKKKTLLISRATYIVEIFLIAFFDGFWIFLVAKIISGVGVSFSSGTNQALVYDSLKKLNREQDYKKVMGLNNFISKVSMAFVFVVGAFLFSIHYKLPAIASLPLIMLAFILTFFFKEPYFSNDKANFRNIFSHLKKGLLIFKGDYFLKYFAFFTFFVGATIIMLLNLSSRYFELILVPVVFIGVISFVLNLTSAFSAKNAHSLENILGEKKSVFLIGGFLFLMVFLMAFMFPYWGVLLFLGLAFLQGFYEIIISDYVNKHVKTVHRATMLSINNMFENIGVFLLFPAIGYFTGLYSLSFALFLFSGFVLVCFLFLVVFYKKHSFFKK